MLNPYHEKNKGRCAYCAHMDMDVSADGRMIAICGAKKGAEIERPCNPECENYTPVC
jgi:hypothetical protein